MGFNFAMRLAAAAGLTLAMAPAIACAAQPPSILTNGSFESPGTTLGDNVRIQLDSSGDDTVTGWHNSGGFQIYENDQDSLAAADGAFYVSFGHNGDSGGSLSQSFDTVLGESYAVDYQVAQQQGEDIDTFFRVSVTGASLSASVDSQTPIFGQWSAGTTLHFTGTGGAVLLTFLDATDNTTSGFNSNLALDNVRVTDLGPGGGAGGVPEPAAWALLIIGFGGAGAMARARRKLETYDA
ncbi:MAG: DUF642 domain-containing protein [Proteobacteria bacterium]|nr:DUF642 domain-containing protein [Pseudomonadota bacterium]